MGSVLIAFKDFQIQIESAKKLVMKEIQLLMKAKLRTITLKRISIRQIISNV